ncbi:MAG TPA: MATE family efflux transporter [Clostridiaceae bacterium]|nr:MATE family efflux transporter [Clostridiaceae bacterium]
MITYFNAPPPNPRLKELMHALIPAVIADQIAATMLGIVNSIMASNVSSVAIAGVGQVDAFNNIFVIFFSALAAGGTVLAAQAAGCNNHESVNHIATQSMTFGLAISTFVSLLIFCLREPILMFLYSSVDESIHNASMDYFFWASLSIPCSFIIAQGGGLFRAVKDAKTPMRISILTNIINLLAGYVLIIGLPGRTGLGAWGAGITIFLSRFIGACWTIWIIRFKGASVKIIPIKKYHLDKSIIQDCIKIGVPAACENGLYYLGRLVIQVMVSKMGALAISANQIVLSIYSIMTLVPNSYALVTQTIVGNFAGKGNKKECAAASYHIGKISLYTCLATLLFIMIFSRIICLAYTRDAEILNLASTALRVFATSLLFWARAVIPGSSLRAMGISWYPMAVNASTMWVFQVLFIAVIVIPLNWGVWGVWLGYGLSTAARAALYLLYEQKGKWLSNVKEQSGNI